jgi:hypothetical protein
MHLAGKISSGTAPGGRKLFVATGACNNLAPADPGRRGIQVNPAKEVQRSQDLFFFSLFNTNFIEKK